MTLNGAIAELVILREHSMMPEIFKGSLDKVIETISECEEPSAQPEPQKWIDHNYYIECPSCKRYVTNRTPYCPYCGGRNE